MIRFSAFTSEKSEVKQKKCPIYIPFPALSPILAIPLLWRNFIKTPLFGSNPFGGIIYQSFKEQFFPFRPSLFPTAIKRDFRAKKERGFLRALRFFT